MPIATLFCSFLLLSTNIAHCPPRPVVAFSIFGRNWIYGRWLFIHLPLMFFGCNKCEQKTDHSWGDISLFIVFISFIFLLIFSFFSFRFFVSLIYSLSFFNYGYNRAGRGQFARCMSNTRLATPGIATRVNFMPPTRLQLGNKGGCWPVACPPT